MPMTVGAAALIEGRLVSDVRGGVQHELANAGNTDLHHWPSHGRLLGLAAGRRDRRRRFNPNI
jgi:hypothetical protein